MKAIYGSLLNKRQPKIKKSDSLKQVFGPKLLDNNIIQHIMQKMFLTGISKAEHPNKKQCTSSI